MPFGAFNYVLCYKYFLSEYICKNILTKYVYQIKKYLLSKPNLAWFREPKTKLFACFGELDIEP